MCFDKKKNNRQKGRFCRQRKTSGEPRDGDFIGDLIRVRVAVLTAHRTIVPELILLYSTHDLHAVCCQLSHAHAAITIASSVLDMHAYEQIQPTITDEVYGTDAK